MKFERTEVWRFDHALRGMRNPMNSWEKSDSIYGYNDCGVCNHNYLCEKCMKQDSSDYSIESPIIGGEGFAFSAKTYSCWGVSIEPESWLQTRTVTMNYENIRNMYFQRRHHKLTEWSETFVSWVKTLPYSKELIMYEGE